MSNVILRRSRMTFEQRGAMSRLLNRFQQTGTSMGGMGGAIDFLPVES